MCFGRFFLKWFVKSVDSIDEQPLEEEAILVDTMPRSAPIDFQGEHLFRSVFENPLYDSSKNENPFYSVPHTDIKYGNVVECSLFDDEEL
jgi:hypothetical protein